jgi:hypothetical protein
MKENLLKSIKIIEHYLKTKNLGNSEIIKLTLEDYDVRDYDSFAIIGVQYKTWPDSDVDNFLDSFKESIDEMVNIITNFRFDTKGNITSRTKDAIMYSGNTLITKLQYDISSEIMYVKIDMYFDFIN